MTLRYFSFLLITAISTLLIAGPSQNIAITYEIKTTGVLKNKPMEGQTQVYFQNGKTRVAVSLKESPFGDIVILQDNNKDKVITLFPEEESYMETSKSEADAAASSANAVSFKPTHEPAATIAGYKCDFFTRETVKGNEKVCVSKELGEEFKDLVKSLEQPHENKAFPTGLSGVPLEYKITAKKDKKAKTGIDTVMRAQKIDKSNLDASLFVVPKGYKQRNMDQMSEAMVKNLGKNPEYQKQMQDLEKIAEEMKRRAGGTQAP